MWNTSLDVEITRDKVFVAKGRGAAVGTRELMQNYCCGVISRALWATRRSHPPVLYAFWLRSTSTEKIGIHIDSEFTLFLKLHIHVYYSPKKKSRLSLSIITFKRNVKINTIILYFLLPIHSSGTVCIVCDVIHAVRLIRQTSLWTIQIFAQRDRPRAGIALRCNS